jgi:hypothetical protein
LAKAAPTSPGGGATDAAALLGELGTVARLHAARLQIALRASVTGFVKLRNYDLIAAYKQDI